ncbi:MAG TPA: AAA family ATPase [Blastocatellia bacterium]|nr:AAA family ATPase [Blastocatellia bacterium]
MELDKLSLEFERALEDARHFAERRGEAFIMPIHLLHVMLDTGGALAAMADKQNLDRAHALNLLLAKASEARAVKLAPGKRPVAGKALRDLIDLAFEVAERRNSELVEPADFLTAALEGGEEGLRSTLRDAGMQAEAVKKAAQAKSSTGEVLGKRSDPGSLLERFGRDLCELARQGKFMPVIGRDQEIRFVIQTLLRKTKNNPVLVGDPGVGKSAIVEGLAQRIVAGDVPDSLKACRLYALDLTLLVAGAKYRGEFEERIKGVVDEVTARQGEIILFLDELHTLVGAGGAAGGLDAANILKPALARGELRCIGATTYDEYRERIEKDGALARRFERVIVEEPDDETALAILRGVRPHYEAHHSVRLPDESLGLTVKLSRRYLRDRFLPDKAIDVIDEATSRIRMQLESKPNAIDELERKFIRIQGEIEALRKDDAAGARLKEAEAAEAQAKLDEMKGRWRRERDANANLQKTRQAIEEQRLALEAAEARGEITRAAEIRYGSLKYLEQQLADLEREVAEIGRDGGLVPQEVGKEEIAEVVARRARIPVARLFESERERMIKLEERIGGRVFGQPQAIDLVASAARQMRADLRRTRRPASFLFVGPTGVGKTEMTKALAEALFDDEDSLIRVDMAEYKDGSSVAGLIGSRPGLVGSDEGGFLTERVRRQPYSVVLFDEVEKGANEVHDLLLGVLGEGRLTDAKGRFCDFSSAMVVCTSNLGVREANDLTDDPKKKSEIIIEVVKARLRPELYNRFDEVICFNSLDEAALEQIVARNLNDLRAKLVEEHGVELEVEPGAMSFLAKKAYDPVYGARPVERTLQRMALAPIAKMLIAEEAQRGQKIMISYSESEGLGIRPV